MENFTWMIKLLKELKRRNVFKAAIAYLVFAWLTLQVVAITFPILQLDLIIQRWIFIVLIIAFPFWLVLAYIFEWTSTGFKITTHNLETESAPTPRSNEKFTQYIMIGLSLAVTLLVADKLFHLTDSSNKISNKVQTIAVLPFSNQSNSSEDLFFTDGVYEDVMTKLSGVQSFRIISKSSVASYKDFQGDLMKVGQKLNAQYIMTGAVRRWENQIRMTVQLIESETNQAIWSNEYNGTLENVFQLQSDIASAITEKLRANLSEKEVQNIETQPTNNLAAYDHFLQARFILNKPRATYDEISKAIQLLELATKADEDFVKAWSLLVLAHSEQYDQLSKIQGRESEMNISKEKAIKALEKAKSLAPNSWEVLSDEGVFYMYIKGDKLMALSSFEKALGQNPSDVLSMTKLSQLYIQFGEIEKSIGVLEEAFKLTQSNGFVSYALSFAYELNGDFEKMIPLLNRLHELYPDQSRYLVESKYYQFLDNGSIESFDAFRKSISESNSENPWDERAIKNMDMIVSMFNNDFDEYHIDWKGKHASHIADHGNWMCPLVANDHINHARLLIDNGKDSSAREILNLVDEIVLRPINPNSVCVFDPQVYLPKLSFLNGNDSIARQMIDKIALEVLQNESFPLGAVERSVLLQAIDLIEPSRVYYYYQQIVKNSISMTSFESICADPWNYPNLLRHPDFQEEIVQDGRFVTFLENYGFM